MPTNNWNLGGSIDSTAFTPICAVRRRSGFEEVPTGSSVDLLYTSRQEW